MVYTSQPVIIVVVESAATTEGRNYSPIDRCLVSLGVEVLIVVVVPLEPGGVATR